MAAAWSPFTAATSMRPLELAGPVPDQLGQCRVPSSSASSIGRRPRRRQATGSTAGTRRRVERRRRRPRTRPARTLGSHGSGARGAGPARRPRRSRRAGPRPAAPARGRRRPAIGRRVEPRSELGPLVGLTPPPRSAGRGRSARRRRSARSAAHCRGATQRQPVLGQGRHGPELAPGRRRRPARRGRSDEPVPVALRRRVGRRAGPARRGRRRRSGDRARVGLSSAPRVRGAGQTMATGSDGRWCRRGTPAAASRPRTRPEQASISSSSRCRPTSTGTPSHSDADAVDHGRRGSARPPNSQITVRSLNSGAKHSPLSIAHTRSSGPSRQWPLLRSVLLARTSKAQMARSWSWRSGRPS